MGKGKDSSSLQSPEGCSSMNNIRESLTAVHRLPVSSHTTASVNDEAGIGAEPWLNGHPSTEATLTAKVPGDSSGTYPGEKENRKKRRGAKVKERLGNQKGQWLPVRRDQLDVI